ncbi:MAG: ribonuclease Z [Bacteroidota bacterium]|nr:ribonuclease Z [Bacteroidota bacterium]
MNICVTILGNSSATPTVSRHPSAQVLEMGNRLFLVDCGEGAQQQMMRYGIRSSRVSRVFISHMHPDHHLGLPGFITSQSLQGRKEELHIHAPPELEEILNIQFRASCTKLRFPLHFYPLTFEGIATIYKDEEITVQSIPVQHRLPCCGFVFRENKLTYNIRKDLAAKGEIPLEAFSTLKKGLDYHSSDGSVMYADQYVLPPAPLRSYAYITDTLYLPALHESLMDVTLLYHEATFMHNLIDKAEYTMHSTAKQAATVARDANAGKLLVGHFSSRYKDLNALLIEARSVFLNTYLAEEGRTFTA